MFSAGRKLWLYLELFAAGFLAVLLALRVIIRYLLPAPEKSLQGKVVVITNCSHPLVATLATELSLRHRCIVACIDRNEVCADELAREIRLAGGHNSTRSYGWLSRSREANALCAGIIGDYGHVDLLITGEGLDSREIRRTEDLRETVDCINNDLMTHFNLTLAFLPGMLSRDNGHIITLSSCSRDEHGSGCRQHCEGGGRLAESLLTELRRSDCQVRLTRVRALAEDDASSAKWRHFTRADVAAEIITGIRKNKKRIQSPGLRLVVRNYVAAGLRARA